MAKKERPRLVMADDVAVTDLQSLKEHFDWEKAFQYYKTGDLLEWLRRLYLDEEADALEQLDSRSADFPKEFCAIFGVEYTGGDKPYIPPSNSRTRTTMGQRRKAPVPPPRPVAIPKPEAPAASPSPYVAPVPENVADAGADFDFGEAFDSDFAEEAFGAEAPPATSTAETLPEVTEASPMPIAEPSEPVPAMPSPPSEPPTDATTDASQDSSQSNSSGTGCFAGCFLFVVVIIGITGIAWSFISSWWSSSDSKEEKTEPPTKIEQQQQKTEEKSTQQSSTQQAASVAPAEKPQNTNISSDLALGGISIGNSADTIFKKLGKPSKQENKGSGMMYYYYPSVEVHCLAGHAVTLVSNSPQAKTSKGIHEGSSLADVLSSYGNNYSKFQYDSDEMYEYEMGTNYGKPMILRFAVKNGRVDYISIRRRE